MRKVAANVFFALSLFFIGLYFTLYSTSQDGTSTPRYQLSNNVFYDQEFARGFVRLANGFTVEKKASGVGSTHGSCVFMDTCVSVSGAIDLRETNTMFLQSDLILDNGVTFSSGGNIYGYDRALILNGDLIIPDGKIIHTGGRIVIDGNGHKLLLGDSAQLFVDTDATLTLRNLVLQNTQNNPGNPAVQCASSGSKFCLDNVELALADDFYFNRGQLFVYNDVAVTGTSAFVYRSTNPSYITVDSTFYFNPGTTFDFRPSTTGTPELLAKDLLFMQDATSQLYLDGCSLKTTMTGMRLTKGQILFDNKVSITSAAQLQLKGMGSWIYVNNDFAVYKLKFSPDGRYIASIYDYSTSGYDIYIYDLSLNTIASANYGSVISTQTYATSIDWSPDGRYLAVGGFPNSSGYELKIYSFDGSSLTPLIFKNFGSDVNLRLRAVTWSPDGKYLSVGGAFMSSGKELEIYRFNGSSLTLVASTDSQMGTNQVFSTSWSPDGRYIAVGEFYVAGGTKLQIYSFNGSSLSLVAEMGNFYNIDSLDWSQDGRYLAIVSSESSEDFLKIYYFNGSSLLLMASQSYEYAAYSVNWSPDNRYVAICGYSIEDRAQIEIYNFDGTSLSITTSQIYETYDAGYSVNFSKDGKYLAVGGSTTLGSGHGEVEIYTLQYGPETQTQVLSNSIVFGNAALGSSYDLNVRMLAGAQVTVDGLLNCDNLN